MFVRPRRSDPSRRGQAMVEFVIVLPVIALLLVMAVDFGRVFFGWVALQNTVRIGADFAAQNWEAWPSDSSPPSVQARADYHTLMENDLEAANCEYPDPLPEPVFEDVDSPADGLDWGDRTTVTFDCQFGLITPLAENILGGPVLLRATSSFALHGSASGEVPDPPTPPCTDPVAEYDSSPAVTPGPNRIDVSGPDPVVTFTDSTFYSSACPMVARTWDFGHDGEESNLEVVPHHFPPHTGGGSTQYTVTLTVETADGTDTVSVTVRVRA